MVRRHLQLVLLGALAASAWPGARLLAARHTQDARQRRPPDGAGPLAMELSGYLASEPAEIVVFVRMSPDARNRSLTIEWWSQDGVGGSHLISLDGDRAAARYDYPIKNIAAGEYTVSAVLTLDDDTQT